MAEYTRYGIVMNTVDLRLTLNGETSEAALGQPTPFHFYDERALAITRLTPAHGPADGGTSVRVRLSDARLLVDLGGVRCRFGDAEVAGRLGESAILCATPPRMSCASSGQIDSSAVRVAVSINGRDFTTVDAAAPQFVFE